MSSGIARAKRMNARKTNILSQIAIILILIALVSSTGCAPRIVNTNSGAVESVPTVNGAQNTTTAPITPTTDRSVTAGAPTSGSLTFIAEADARVKASNPTQNYGSGATLQVDGASDSGLESFLQFTVTGVSSKVQHAVLRLFVTDNGTNDGPAIYLTDNSWKEKDINWNNRPQPSSDVLDNKGSIDPNSWVEYNVTSRVTGDGTFSFVLIADSNDGVVFSSRQGSKPPQLELTFGDGVTTTSESTSTPSSAPTISANTADTPTTSAGGVIFVGAGDISECDNNNDELTAQLLESIPGTVFTTGDNAYNDGSPSQYADCYNPTWGRLKDRTKPIPGNHEYRTKDAAGYFQYFNNIQPYYAYDLGSWRIYALNSEINVSENSPQVIWLLADLATHPSKCVLAYWHQPRWSSGNHHGSNTEYQTLWQILYSAGAELVLNGHEHNYERFAPMNATGQPDPMGMREFVIGTGGRDHYGFGSPLPTSEVRDSTSYGVLKLTLRDTGYDWEFVSAEGSTFTDRGSAECH